MSAKKSLWKKRGWQQSHKIRRYEPYCRYCFAELRQEYMEKYQRLHPGNHATAFNEKFSKITPWHDKIARFLEKLNNINLFKFDWHVRHRKSHWSKID